MALTIRSVLPAKAKLLTITLIATFALVAQPFYSLVSSHVANALSLGDTYKVSSSYDSDCSDLKCNSLQGAVDSASDGDTIKIITNLSIHSQVTVDKMITVDGGGRTLWGEFTRTSNSNNSIIGLQAAATIKNLTVNGKWQKDIHGINAWHTDGQAKVQDVGLKNLGHSGLVVGERAQVLAENITSSNNGWNAINVDKPGSHLTLVGVNEFSENPGVPVVYVDNISTPTDVVINESLYGIRDNYVRGGDRAYFTKTAPVTDISAKFQRDAANLVEGQWLNINSKANNNLVLNFDAPAGARISHYITTETRPNGEFERIWNSYNNTWLAAGKNAVGVVDSKAEFGMHGDGEYRYSVVAYSDDNGTASDPVVYTLNYDKTPPAVTLASPAGTVSTTKPFTISGTYEDVNGDRIQSGVGRLHLHASANGNKLSQPFIVPSSQLNSTSGAFEYTLSQEDLDRLVDELNLKDKDTLTIRANVHDNANNWANYSNEVRVDNTAPVMKNVTSDGENIEGKTLRGKHDFQVNFEEDDLAKAHVEYMRNEYNAKKKEWEYKKKTHEIIKGVANPVLQIDTNRWDDGQYQIKVTQITDKAGNTTPARTVKFTVDNTPPEVEIVSPTKDTLHNGEVSITGTIVDDNISQYYLVVNACDDTCETLHKGNIELEEFTSGKEFTLFTVPAHISGEIRVLLEARDLAGNKEDNPSTDRIVFHMDNKAPEAPKVDSVGANSVGGTAEPYSTVSVYAGDDYLGSTDADEDGNWVFALKSPLSEGTVITARATDAAGNISRYAEEFTVTNEEDEDEVIVITSLALFGGGDDNDLNGRADRLRTPFGAAANPAVPLFGTLAGNSQSNDNEDGEVLGARTDDDNGSNVGEILGATADTDTNEGSGGLLGLAWHWWLVILAGVGLASWAALAAMRTRREDAELGL